MLPEADRERLLHMREAAREACGYVAGLHEEDFRSSSLVQRGVQHCLFIIGEAAAQTSDATREQFPEIEWDVMRGLRNRLAHAYFAIDLQVIWKTATVDLPRLLEDLERIAESFS